MLSGDDARSGAAATAAVEGRVRRIIAETAGWGSTGGSLRDPSLDSLTLIAIVTRIEAVFAIAFNSDEIVALLGARDARELAVLVMRKVAQTNLAEATGNGSC